MRLGLLALGAIVGLGACSSAAAQSVPVVDAKRQIHFGFNLDTQYDSNIGHTNAALSQARGIIPEDETVRPSATFDLVEPLGRQAVFLQGQAGYDFHRRNKRLDRQNIDLTGGGLVVLSSCRSTLYGRYAAVQSDLAELAASAGLVKNLNTTASEGVAITCGGQRGFNGQVNGQHVDVTNSAAQQQIADHRIDGGAAAFGYANESLGNLQLTGSYSTQTFPSRIDANGHRGDSYWNQMLGVNYTKNLGSKIKVQATAGQTTLHRQSAPVGIPLKVSGFNYAAAVGYQMSNRLGFSLQSSRQFQPSNRAGKLYDLATSTDLNGKYNLGTRFVITLGGTIEDIASNRDTSVAAPPTPTNSHKKVGYGSVQYRQSERASLVLDLRQEERKTDLPAFNYTDTRATLTLAVSF